MFRFFVYMYRNRCTTKVWNEYEGEMSACENTFILRKMTLTLTVKFRTMTLNENAVMSTYEFDVNYAGLI
jgi:hypothetical protein